MKQFTFTILALLCGAITIGCQTDGTDQNLSNGGSTELVVSLPDTRTSVGEKSGKTYPIYWSEGDCIVVNGEKSKEAVIDSEERNRAVFSIDGSPAYPLHVTYPYTSTTTHEAPKIVLPTEQQYTENTFATGTLPMCGYIENSGDKLALTHLAGVLRFPVTSATEGVTLQKIVITSLSGAKLSGEFAVDCKAGTMTACDNTESYIAYTLPENFTLSASESIFYITIPAGNAGSCVVEFIESSGEKMVCSLSDNNINGGTIREFKTVPYKRGTTATLEMLDSENDTLEIYYPTVYGYVKDTNGNPIEGVAVSDGFQVVATNENGYYTLNNVTKDTWYIYISLPAEYEVPLNEYGQPCFYKKFPSGTAQYDFTLTPLTGGKESQFALFAIGDPQVRTNAQFSRFNSEAVPAIKAHSAEVTGQGIPCYGITLGDIIANSDGTNTEFLRDDMRDAFAVPKAGLPVFQVYGNHDNTYYGDGVIISADDRSSTFELKAQRNHEEFFGPVDYSFNRGDIHIIGMRNIVYQHNDKSGKYAEGFLAHQYEWLKQDLALIPKDKMVVLCVHAPLFRNTGNYVEEVLTEINKFKEAHVVSGHTHISQYYEFVAENPETPYPNVFEHNVGALCGVWWRGNIAADGAPTGYNVFMCNGSEFSESYFMGINEGMNTKDVQMRLHRGNAVTGREKLDTDTYEGIGYYAFNFGEDVLIANLFNVDRIEKISVYEDGEYSGEMEQIGYGTKPTSTDLVGDLSLADPRRMKDGLEYAIDMYTAGFYYCYYSGRSAWTDCTHLYKYKLKNKDADIKVVVTDRYGKTFEEEDITEGTDYSLVAR